MTTLKGITDVQKKIIEERYLCLLDEFQRRAFFYAFLFHSCRFIITVGSLIVPALLSIQYVDAPTNSLSMDPATFTFRIYWTTWVISLMVTTANGVFTLFKVDKKYYLLHTLLEQMRSEGWQYLQLSGRFSGFYTPGNSATHDNQFLFFCHAIEKLKMKQVEEEYFKSAEGNLHTGHTSATTKAIQDQDGAKNTVQKGAVAATIPAFFTDGLQPPTPLNAQLRQLLQVLTVDGGPTSSNGSKSGEATTEVSVRPEMQGKSTGQESVLQKASGTLRQTESSYRMGAEISAQPVEQESQAEKNP